MERSEALRKLNDLVGRDVHELAKDYSVEVRNAAGNVNKGWAGHVFERHLGLPINSAQAPNFGSWELKVIPLKQRRDGRLRFAETMAVTMIDAPQVALTPFEQSHLLTKLKRAVVVARVVGEDVDQPSIIHSINPLDLKGELYEVVRQDYEAVRACINDPKRGFKALSGSMGEYIQPRTKGRGHGSVSRAFYARPVFLAQFIDISDLQR
jgi:DNA mismatch repair protein MutH